MAEIANFVDALAELRDCSQIVPLLPLSDTQHSSTVQTQWSPQLAVLVVGSRFLKIAQNTNFDLGEIHLRDQLPSHVEFSI
jgi:glutamate formiminotransferase